MLGSLLGSDLIRPSTWRCWVKTHGTHNAPIFPSGEFVLPRLEKYCFFFNLYIIGNSGPLILACSNAHVSEEYTIYGVALSTTF